MNYRQLGHAGVRVSVVGLGANRFGSPDAAIKHFVESRGKTEEFLKTTPDLRGHAVDSPAGGKWDAYEFVLMIAAHSERHTKQIEEVKTSAGYPAK